jgi:hypothetical protein
MRKVRLLWLLLVLLGTQPAWAQDFTPGQSYYGANNYTEYKAGNLPLIISVPHGGELKPDGISDRSCSQCVIINDAYTQELGNQLFQAIKELTGCYPHLIINRLHRSKMDANRDIAEAALGDPEAEEAWIDFQRFIDTAKFQVAQQFKKGLFIDLHGHAHDIQRIEWGYLLSRNELQSPDDQLDRAAFINQTSIKNLVNNNPEQLSLSELIRGELSLGTLTAEKGFAGVPSGQDPYPDDGESYFSGGYNTRRHGSIEQGPIDGVQVECHRNIRFREGLRQTFADRFADVLIQYLQLHYFDGELDASCLFTTLINEQSSSLFSVYPNPARDFLYSEGGSWPDELQLFDPMGRLVHRWEGVQTRQLDLPVLRKGLYILMVYENGKLTSRSKIVIGY